MKNCLSILLFLITRLAMANMSSPMWDGTFTASPLTSKNIDILDEKIQIEIDKNFRTASFDIQYHIRTDVSGDQIPLLFYAKDYKGGFRVWVDEKEDSLNVIPYNFLEFPGSDTVFADFDRFFTPDIRSSPHTIIYWEKGIGVYCILNDLKYFKINLEKGEHIIHVKYTAISWTDTYNWVNEYSFRYSLSPAKYWRSFGSLEISLKVPRLDEPITTNLGQPVKGDLTSTTEWKFTKLPDEFILINYQPEANFLAKILILIHPVGLSLILAFFLLLLSRRIILKYTTKHPAEKTMWLIILNCIMASFLILAGFVLFFPLIDFVIGTHAGEYHGHTFVIIILLPVLAPLYGLVLWLITRKRIPE
jgi:hypothetical protein